MSVARTLAHAVVALRRARLVRLRPDARDSPGDVQHAHVRGARDAQARSCATALWARAQRVASARPRTLKRRRTGARPAQQHATPAALATRKEETGGRKLRTAR